jgi:hypothetical protein
MAGRDPSAYARRNFGWLLALFGAFLAFGLLRGNAAAVLGGAGGIAWLLWAARRGA